MKDKEKAASFYLASIDGEYIPEQSRKAFLAGCAYQEQVDREVIERLIELCWSIDDYTIHIGCDSRTKCESYNNCTCGLTKFRQELKSLAAYHKATGQETEKE